MLKNIVVILCVFFINIYIFAVENNKQTTEQNNKTQTPKRITIESKDALNSKKFNYPSRNKDFSKNNETRNSKSNITKSLDLKSNKNTSQLPLTPKDTADILKKINSSEKDASQAFNLQKNIVQRHFFSLSNTNYLGVADINVNINNEDNSFSGIYNNSLNFNYSYAIFPSWHIGVSLSYFLYSPNLTNENKNLNIKITDQFLYLLTTSFNVYNNNKFSLWIVPKVGGFSRNININDNNSNANVKVDLVSFGLQERATKENTSKDIQQISKVTDQGDLLGTSYYYQAKDLYDACLLNSRYNSTYNKANYFFVLSDLTGYENRIRSEYNKPSLEDIYEAQSDGSMKFVKSRRNEAEPENYYVYFDNTVTCSGVFIKKADYANYLKKQSFTTNLNSFAYGLDVIANYDINSFFSLFFNIGYLSILKSNYKQIIGDSYVNDILLYEDPNNKNQPLQLKYNVNVKTMYYSALSFGMIFKF